MLTILNMHSWYCERQFCFKDCFITLWMKGFTVLLSNLTALNNLPSFQAGDYFKAGTSVAVLVVARCEIPLSLCHQHICAQSSEKHEGPVRLSLIYSLYPSDLSFSSPTGWRQMDLVCISGSCLSLCFWTGWRYRVKSRHRSSGTPRMSQSFPLLLIQGLHRTCTNGLSPHNWMKRLKGYSIKNLNSWILFKDLPMIWMTMFSCCKMSEMSCLFENALYFM